MLWAEMCKDVSLITLCHNSSVILIFWKIFSVVTIDFQQHFQEMAVRLDVFLVEKINATVHPCLIVVCIWLEKNTSTDYLDPIIYNFPDKVGVFLSVHCIWYRRSSKGPSLWFEKADVKKTLIRGRIFSLIWESSSAFVMTQLMLTNSHSVHVLVVFREMAWQLS